MAHERMTQDGLIEEMIRRFGRDHTRWAFLCPSCGDVASIGDFIALGVDPARAGQDCIGRHLGALKREQPKGGYQGRGCDWCAYGLFRGPVEYVTESGESLWGFRIAPA